MRIIMIMFLLAITIFAAVMVFSLIGFILIGKALNDNALGNEWDDMEDEL